MKGKLLILSALASLSLAMPAIAKTRVVETTPDGRPIVSSTGKHWRNHYRDSRGSWALASGLGRHFTAGIMAAFQDITVAILTPSATARIVTDTDMAATTRAIRTTTVAPC